MSKYNELKNRIEALNNGWDREADDIIEDIISGSEKKGLLVAVGHEGGDNNS